MKRSLLAPLAPLLALLSFAAMPIGVRAGGLDLTPKWQQTFPDSVRWYLRTSLGILLVRSGKALIALDGVDGKQLWSFPEIEINGWLGTSRLAARGNNLFEIPGYSILLINRAKLNGSKDETGELLAVDLWTGEVLWKQAALEDLATLVPLYDSGRILLVTRKLASERVVFDSLPYVQPAVFLALADASPPFHPEMYLMDISTGRMDWKSEYPRALGPLFFDVRELYGHLFLHEANGKGSTILGSIDLQTGNRSWESAGSPNFSLGAMPMLQAVNDHVIMGSNGVAAFDPASGIPAWNATEIGHVAGLITDGDTVLGSGSKGAFALDAKTGGVRWRTRGWGYVTNPVLYKESHILAFCDVTDVIVLDTSSAKILRKVPLGLREKPEWVSRVGKKYLLAFTGEDTGVYDVESGKKIAFEAETKGTFPGASFLMRQYMPSVGAAAPPVDIRRDLQQAWPSILERAKKSENGQKTLERLQLFLNSAADGPDSSDSTVYGTDVGNWTLWRVNPQTGHTEAIEFEGSQPDASLNLGLAYFVSGKTLEAVEWNSSYKTYQFEFPQK